MTKNGYKNKFLKTYATLTGVLFITFLYTSKNFANGAFFGQLLYSAYYMFIPSIVIAFIWEFFSE